MLERWSGGYGQSRRSLDVGSRHVHCPQSYEMGSIRWGLRKFRGEKYEFPLQLNDSLLLDRKPNSSTTQLQSFVKFADNLLNVTLRKAISVQSLVVFCKRLDDARPVAAWISSALLLGIQRLDVHISSRLRHPSALLHSLNGSNLGALYLWVDLGPRPNPIPNGLVFSFPKLKVLAFHCTSFKLVNSVLSGCPVLEVLVVNCDPSCFQEERLLIRVPSLKVLWLRNTMNVIFCVLQLDSPGLLHFYHYGYMPVFYPAMKMRPISATPCSKSSGILRTSFFEETPPGPTGKEPRRDDTSSVAAEAAPSTTKNGASGAPTVAAAGETQYGPWMRAKMGTRPQLWLKKGDPSTHHKSNRVGGEVSGSRFASLADAEGDELNTDHVAPTAAQAFTSLTKGKGVFEAPVTSFQAGRGGATRTVNHGESSSTGNGGWQLVRNKNGKTGRVGSDNSVIRKGKKDVSTTVPIVKPNSTKGSAHMRAEDHNQTAGAQTNHHMNPLHGSISQNVF
ncbi:Unknown protein [Striga hermonthica]|uniref:F-box/LRR-repeat protein 15/At3g58940/PEG3-like LRR domain-containing protein n=1 Tax=Striga hermonthica TaxID=68872 RepID=A0A9N7N987_STRHE|nr:Unknown protein [Striga hermonthica]